MSVAIVPKNVREKISFFQVHIDKWIERAPEIGADPVIVAELAGQIEAARAAFAAQQQAYNAARSATMKMQLEIDRMARLGASVIGQVRAKAMSAVNENEIYVLAGLPVPAKRSRRGEPGKPFDFAVELQAIGWLTLTWKCRNPRGSEGTIYRISRQDGGVGPYKFLDTVGVKRFVDTTVPLGTVNLMYQIQAVRSTRVGPVARFDVTFGGGAMPPAFRTAA